MVNVLVTITCILVFSVGTGYFTWAISENIKRKSWYFVGMNIGCAIYMVAKFVYLIIKHDI